MARDPLHSVLKISPAAVELRLLIEFIFTPSEQQYFIWSAAGMNLREINQFVFAKRKEKIDTTRFATAVDFVELYYQSKQTALERLFQEPLSIQKLNMITIDPEPLFSLHLQQSPYIRFMNFTVFI